MKTTLIALILVLSGLELWAQPAPTPGGANPAGVIPRNRFQRFGNTNGSSMTQPRFPVAGAPGAPGAPGGAGAPGGIPAPGGPGPTATTPAAAAAMGDAVANAQPEETIPPGTINFQGVDVNQVLEIYAKLVGRTLLRSSLPDAKIILKTETPLTKTETIQALEAVLAMNNIAVIPIGNKFVKVLPVDQANTAAADLNTNNANSLPNLGSYITHIAQLHYVKPSVMIPLIQPFGKLQGGLTAIDDNGILVMRDYAENIKRMLEMIDRIDVSVPAEYVSEVIPIRYAKVAEIAAALNSLGGGGGATVSMGGSSSSSTISGLSGGNRTGLGGTTSGLGSSTSSGLGSTTSRLGGTTTTANGTSSGATTFQQRINNLLNKATGTGTGGSGGSSQDIQLFGQTKIIPDENSSSLLIFATRQDLVMIKEIIAKLDVPLAQVLIEAIIMDVTIGHTFSFGTSVAQNPASNGNVIGGGGVNNGQSFMNFVQSLTTNSSGNTVSTIASSTATNSAFGNNLGGGFSYFGSIGPNWDVAVSAAQSDNNASIIQRPRIQASQAKPAQFFVGETKPYVTSTYNNSYSGGYGGSSYSQLSVGVELDVTPYINPDGMVGMEIQQEVDDFNGTTAITGVGDVPNTIKRTMNTTLTVRDRDAVMLGGFIKSDKSHSQSGVPFLSDIPILGNLFKQRSDSKDRQELIVLMRPTVLKTPELAAKHTIQEKTRLPGISAAAAEDAEYERKLEDEQRKVEKKRSKKTGYSDGFFNEASDDATNTPAVTPPATGDTTSTNSVP